MVAYALNLLDMVLTLHALDRGAVELNPLMRYVPMMVVYKVVIIGSICRWLCKRESRLARWGLVVSTIVYGAVDTWHIINLI